MQADKLLRYYLRQIPLVRLYLFFIGGIVWQHFFPGTTILLIALVLILIACIAFFLKTNKQHQIENSGKGMIASLILFSAGILYTFSTEQTLIPATQNSNWWGVIISDIQKSDNHASFIATLHNKNNTEGVKTKIWIAQTDTSLQPGDSIEFSGTLQQIKNRNNPNEFDYAGYLARKGIYYQTFIRGNNFAVVPVKHPQKLNISALRWRAQLIAYIDSFELSEENKSILYALSLGYKDLLEDETRDKFAHSGTMHLLAVSGLHLGIIYMVLNFLFSMLPLKRKQYYTLIIISVIWIYALLTGLSTSVVRAAIMFTFIGLGKALQRDVNIYNILAAAAFLLTIINPLVIFEVGFQLSFAAVTGIVYFQPFAQKWFPISNRLLNYFFQLFSVSVIAQLVTLPFTLFYFHQFPVYFWLSNMLVIPIVFLLLISTIFFLASFPFPFIQSILHKVLSGLLITLNKSVSFIDDFPQSHIENIGIDRFEAILITLIVLTFGALLFMANFKKTILLFSLCIVLFSYDSWVQWKAFNTHSMVLFNTSKKTLLCKTVNQTATLITDDSATFSTIKNSFIVKNHLIQNHIKNVHIHRMDSISNHNFLINDLSGKLFMVQQPIIALADSIVSENVDLVVIKNIYPEKQILSDNNIQRIVLTNNVNYYLRTIWKLAANTYEIPIHDLSENGALTYAPHK